MKCVFKKDVDRYNIKMKNQKANWTNRVPINRANPKRLTWVEKPTVKIWGLGSSPSRVRTLKSRLAVLKV
jgi:hypothetical protein